MESKIIPLLGIISQNKAIYTVQFNNYYQNGLLFSNYCRTGYDQELFTRERDRYGIEFPIIDWSSTTEKEAFQFALYYSIETPDIHTVHHIISNVANKTQAQILTVDGDIISF